MARILGEAGPDAAGLSTGADTRGRDSAEDAARPKAGSSASSQQPADAES